ncbi:SAM-dependent methyltransferase [Neorhizobium sp. 2083]|uniref:methyltransferase domain-containing protein n=1 Tax=Neorhizobium sp. 2083 TaxID=2817762 RepID=UPI002860948F|nr:methyltransferase domain-containing protein [Neorhizobium sp. 2083]MDR6816455.1 SAM-dependent methyltransferase [Neorhizobium sp. 2083]
MLRQNVKSLAQMWGQWVAGVQYEINYWDRWLGSRGGQHCEDFANRMTPDRPIDGMIGPIIDRLPKPDVQILDIGAGPLTCLGATRPGYRLEIVPTDALADQYDRLLEKHRIRPQIRTMFALGEDIELLFGQNTFDIVHCQNALDHAIDPVRVLLQMLTVCRVGGYVMLRHAHNEAEHEQYSGFHQWNLTMRHNDFVIWNRDHDINFSDEVAGFASHEVLMSEGYLINVFRKRNDVPVGLGGDFSNRIASFQSAVVASLGTVEQSNLVAPDN